MDGSQRLSWMDECNNERQTVLFSRVGGSAADDPDFVDSGLGVRSRSEQRQRYINRGLVWLILQEAGAPEGLPKADLEQDSRPRDGRLGDRVADRLDHRCLLFGAFLASVVGRVLVAYGRIRSF